MISLLSDVVFRELNLLLLSLLFLLLLFGLVPDLTRGPIEARRKFLKTFLSSLKNFLEDLSHILNEGALLDRGLSYLQFQGDV